MCSEKCSKSLIVDHTLAINIGHLDLFDNWSQSWCWWWYHLIRTEPDFAYDDGDDDFNDDDDVGDGYGDDNDDDND